MKKQIKITKKMALIIKSRCSDVVLWGDYSPITAREIKDDFFLVVNDQEEYSLVHKVQGYWVENIFAARNVPEYIFLKAFGLKAFIIDKIKKISFYLDDRIYWLKYFSPLSRLL